MIHHSCLGIPCRVSKGLGQASCQSGYLPVDVVLPPYLVDVPRNKRIWLLSQVILRFEHIVPDKLGHDIGSSNAKNKIVVVIWPPQILREHIVISEASKKLLDIWSLGLIDGVEPICELRIMLSFKH